MPGPGCRTTGWSSPGVDDPYPFDPLTLGFELAHGRQPRRVQVGLRRFWAPCSPSVPGGTLPVGTPDRVDD